ncbi:hypothetical protein LCGC14_2614070 [marine sediment metagenome]|uniref:Uncharacterized protein n=1 Tax=marine sediment metagenome TaxID=412755 RepID=A0A0F9CG48_9ZZZZ
MALEDPSGYNLATIQLSSVNAKLKQYVLIENRQLEVIIEESKKVTIEKEPELKEQHSSYFKKSTLKISSQPDMKLLYLKKMKQFLEFEKCNGVKK